MAELDVGEAGGHLEGAVEVGPGGGGDSGFEGGGEIIWPGEAGTIVRVFAGFGGVPFEPVFGGGAEWVSANPATEAIEVARDGFEVGFRDAVMTVLGDGALAAVVEDFDFHAVG